MGEVFAGRYELVDPVGRGGVGAVWRAWDHRRRRYVAAKVLQQRDAHALLRFVREQALRIDHPNVLAPASWAADDDQVLFTMDLVAGGSLVHLVGDYGPLPPAFVCTLLDQLLAGLAAVHAEGVVHRDIKPANLLLEATGTGRPRLRLSDFGIAMRLGEPRLTETNLVVGTPGYLAPEQMMGAEPDFPADLFAVGLVALYLLEGAKPDAKALVQYFAEHGTPPAPQGIPEPLWQVVAALVQPDPAARFRTATGARKALAAAAELLPEPGPDDELIEIFDQVGPLPPGFTADGPLVRATGLNRTPPSAHGPITPPSPHDPITPPSAHGPGTPPSAHGPGTPPAPRSDSPPLAAPPSAPPSGRRSAPGDGDPSGTAPPATDRAPEPSTGPTHTPTPPPGTPSPSPTPHTPSSDGRPAPAHGNPTGPGTPSPGTDPAPEPPNSPAHTGTPPPGTPWSSPGPVAPPSSASVPPPGGLPPSPVPTGTPPPSDRGPVTPRAVRATPPPPPSTAPGVDAAPPASGGAAPPPARTPAPPDPTPSTRAHPPHTPAADQGAPSALGGGPSPRRPGTPGAPHPATPSSSPDSPARPAEAAMSETDSFRLPPPRASAAAPPAPPHHGAPLADPHPPHPSARQRDPDPPRQRDPDTVTAPYTARNPRETAPVPTPPPAHAPTSPPVPARPQHRAARRRRRRSGGPPARVAVPVLLLALVCYAVGFWALARL
ncbi:protein kinase [Streptomyces sp. Babs14]|uniref:protein kinase domain-containing protein n=1 Tax=unclassified Streptomyces TaxID=2593676 RepID=UPI001C239EB4|nr:MULTISPECIES: serine/threonine-protein kinase [unclassified Streptomyces]MBU8550754.1 protein kinase [Streptomyces sp. Osf17]MBU8557535.1 protein kinase [Streptomyces sp. Babs14]